MSKVKKVSVGVHRSGGRRDSFSVECGKFTTLLEALDEIRAHHDNTIVHRHSCHHGSCGTCGVVANGHPVLACITLLSDLGSSIEVAPLPGFPIIADLAVDTSSVVAKFPFPASNLRESAGVSATSVVPTPPQEIDAFARFEDCIECGLCDSACPVTREFLGPAALAAANREISKQPDRAGEILESVSSKDGVAACEQAYECSRVCPTGVFPGRHISELRGKIGAISGSSKV